MLISRYLISLLAFLEILSACVTDSVVSSATCIVIMQSIQEQSIYRGLVLQTAVPELVAMENSSSLQTLDSAMCREVTAEATLTAVERLFKATPTNQHRAIAIKVTFALTPGQFSPI